MSLTSVLLFVPKLLLDPRGTISRRAFAAGFISLLVIWLYLQSAWFVAWVVSFDGCTRFVPEHSRQALIRYHMDTRVTGAFVVSLLLFFSFVLMTKRLRAAGVLSVPVFALAVGAYVVGYAAGWVSDYWSAYNCGDVDRVVPRRREFENAAFVTWAVAQAAFSVLMIYLLASSLKPNNPQAP